MSLLSTIRATLKSVIRIAPRLMVSLAIGLLPATGFAQEQTPQTAQPSPAPPSTSPTDATLKSQLTPLPQAPAPQHNAPSVFGPGLQPGQAPMAESVRGVYPAPGRAARCSQFGAGRPAAQRRQDVSVDRRRRRHGAGEQSRHRHSALQPVDCRHRHSAHLLGRA